MKMNQKIIYVLLSVSAERRNQERPCCTLRVRQNVVLHTVLRDSLRSNRSSHLLRSRVQSPHFIPFFDFVELAYARHSPSNLVLPLINRDFLAVATV